MSKDLFYACDHVADDIVKPAAERSPLRPTVGHCSAKTECLQLTDAVVLLVLRRVSPELADLHNILPLALPGLCPTAVIGFEYDCYAIEVRRAVLIPHCSQ